MQASHDAILVPANTPRAIGVFVAEDHLITLWGLKRLIDAAGSRMAVVGSASTHAELMADDAVCGADVILLDLNLGGHDMGASLSQLRQRCRGRILVLTGADDIALHRDAVVKGARGVVHKSEPAETILRAIEKVDAGEIWVHRALLGEVMGMLTDGAPAASRPPADPEAERIASLTPREREIVCTMVRNSAAKQFAVASDLGMSEHTLRNHLTTIYSKLGVRGRLELHLYASARGLGHEEAPRRAA